MNSDFKSEPNLTQEHNKSLWYYAWKRLRRNRLAMLGLVTLSLLIIDAITADLISPFDPDNQILEYATKPLNFKGEVLVKRIT